MISAWKKPILIAALFLHFSTAWADQLGDVAGFPAGTVIDRFSGEVIKTADMTGFEPVSQSMVGHRIYVGGQSMQFAPGMSFKMGKVSRAVPEGMHPNVNGEYIVAILFREPMTAASVGLMDQTQFQTLLAKDALEDKELGVRIEAVKKLTDQTLLAKVAAETKDSRIRGDAVGKLTDQNLLAKVAVETKDPNVHRNAVAKLTDQTLLAKFAVEDEDFSVREAAVANLTNQTVLAKVAAEEKYYQIRQAAVAKLTDQTLLAKFAKYRDPYVRRAAVAKLTDQTLLAKFPVEDEDSVVRQFAVANLTNQTVLAKVAVEDEDYHVRQAAVTNLTDQIVLAKVAVEDKVLYVRRAAVPNLKDQYLLAQIGGHCKWLDIRVAAILKVTDQTRLKQWGATEPQAAIRQAAVNGINDDHFLLERLPIEPSASVRSAIINALREKNSLRQAALTAYHAVDRDHASERFGPPDQDMMAALKSLADQVKTLAGETDSKKLLDAALKAEFDVLRCAAAKRLTDSPTLELLVKQTKDREILMILLAKLDDKTTLERLAKATETDSTMRLACAQKSGATTWSDIFSAATAQSATVQNLGDAIAAVSLYPSVQTEAKYQVQQACLNLIRLGDESRIPEMAELLEGYGDKTLAEDYLNCGQPDLDGSGRMWGAKRGYNIEVGNGSSRAQWGGGR